MVLAYALLAGCAEMPKQAFNARKATQLKRVVLVHPENQTEYATDIVNHPGVSFGLIGGLIAAADIQTLHTGH
jgi:hypothetical protein